MFEKFRWCEICEVRELSRAGAIAEFLQESGVEQEFTFFQSEISDFRKTFENAVSAGFSHIRIGGDLRDHCLQISEQWPANMLSVRSADAMVLIENQWWSRNFLIEGLVRVLNESTHSPDLSYSVLVIGATAETRAVVAVLTRLGFRNFLIADPDRQKSESFTAQFKRFYFGVSFEAIEPSRVTQLPGACSVAVNTLTPVRAQGMLDDLMYFNFLKPNGVWLDLSLVPHNLELEQEARTVGADVKEASSVFARADWLWLKHETGIENLEFTTLLDKLKSALSRGS